MPTRLIKESCRSSKNLDKLSDFEERLFWRLITTADDYGRFLADPELVRSACFPYKSISIQAISKALLGLQKHSLITLYIVGDRQYGEFVTFSKHQGKPRSNKSKYPPFQKSLSLNNNELDAFLQADASKCMQVHANVPGAPDTDTDTDLNSSSLNSSLRVVSSLEDEDFEKFWDSYPRKVGKKDALKAWGRASDKPSIGEILQSVAMQKMSDQWMKDDGKFIPHPSTWLNHGRWSDVVGSPGSSLQRCQSRVKRGNFYEPCGELAVAQCAGKSMCQSHKEQYAVRQSCASPA